jgi:hypothetical protein
MLFFFGGQATTNAVIVVTSPYIRVYAVVIVFIDMEIWRE